MNKLDLDYQNLLKDILENGAKKETRNGGTISVFGRQIRHKMSEGFTLLTTKKIHFKSVVTELLWFLKGRTDLRSLLQHDCHIWTGDAYKVYDKDFDREHPAFSAPYPKRLTQKEFEEKIMSDDEFNRMYGDLGLIYGAQWRNWEYLEDYDYHEGDSYPGTKSVDQIANLINDLKTNPDSRRLMVSAWNVGEIDSMVLPPCHYGFQVWTRELYWGERAQTLGFMEGTKEELRASYLRHPNKEKYPFNEAHTLEDMLDILNAPKRAISLMWNQRSVDTFLGLPFNIASYGLLLEIIAKMVNMVPDELIGNLGDTHLYLDHLDQAKEQMSREPYSLPKLVTGKTPAFFESLSNHISLFGHLDPDDFRVENYQSHPAIKAPLSN